MFPTERRVAGTSTSEILSTVKFTRGGGVALRGKRNPRIHVAHVITMWQSICPILLATC